MVDVEDRDDSMWHNLSPLEGGLSGWSLLWDRWCPIPALRCPLALAWGSCWTVMSEQCLGSVEVDAVPFLLRCT